MIKVLRFAIITMILALFVIGCAGITMHSRNEHSTATIKPVELILGAGITIPFNVPEEFPDDWSNAAAMPMDPNGATGLAQVTVGKEGPDMMLYSLMFAWDTATGNYTPLYVIKCKYDESQNPSHEEVNKNCTCWIYCESGTVLFVIPLSRAVQSMNVMALTPGDITHYKQIQDEFCGKSCER